MLPFKPSVHRMYFIDKLVREKTYPTTVSLAATYQEKYGVSVDPRTIAADIAAMKEAYQAPLSYDYREKGYFYSNPNFRLPVLKNEGEEALPVLAGELQPRSAELPEWQRNFIASLVDKVLPLSKGSAEKTSILLNVQGSLDGSPIKEPLLAALERNTALTIKYLETGKKQVSFLFRPLHLICTLGDNLVFGHVRFGTEEQYKLLFLNRIKSAIPHNSRAVIAPYVHIQSTGNRDIEVVVAGEHSDLLLVFSIPDGGKGAAPEYRLLVQTEIFARD